MIQRGCAELGASVRPIAAFATAASPLMFPVCRMCVYSWVISPSSQSS
jgi:hypothetical protein